MYSWQEWYVKKFLLYRTRVGTIIAKPTPCPLVTEASCINLSLVSLSRFSYRISNSPPGWSITFGPACRYTEGLHRKVRIKLQFCRSTTRKKKQSCKQHDFCLIWQHFSDVPGRVGIISVSLQNRRQRSFPWSSRSFERQTLCNDEEKVSQARHD